MKKANLNKKQKERGREWGTEARINPIQIHQRTTVGHETGSVFTLCWKKKIKQGKRLETKSYAELNPQKPEAGA